MILAVIFDLDGLLVDSEPCWFRAKTDLFKAYDMVWTDGDQVNTMGVSTMEWASYISDRLDQRISPEKVIEGLVARIEAYYLDHVPLMPGAKDVVKLTANNYPIGLASGSHPRLIEAALTGAGWTETFTQIVSGDEVAKGKPAPDIYYEIARRMDIPLENSIVFEDSAYGILSGRAAGAKVIAVPNSLIRPTQAALDQANLVIESLEDFRLEMLQNLGSPAQA